MLPFLKPRKMSSLIIASRKKDGTAAEAVKEDETHPKLLEAAEHMVSAVHEKDASKVAEAMRMAHEHLNTSQESESEE